jgi:hypothetical protein
MTFSFDAKSTYDRVGGWALVEFGEARCAARAAKIAANRKDFVSVCSLGTIGPPRGVGWRVDSGAWYVEPADLPPAATWRAGSAYR